MDKVLILANDFKTIYNFRRELLSRLIKENYRVFISIPENINNKVFESIGCTIAKINMSRSGTNPVAEFLLIKKYINLIKRIKPDVVLTYTAKPNIYGSLACEKCKVPYFNTITGLGSVFQNENVIKKIMLFLQKKAYKKSNCIFFQNSDNMKYFIEKKIVNKKNITLIPGSGVNLDLHKYKPYPDTDELTRFIFVSRIRKDKGFDELFESIKFISDGSWKVEFHIVGWYEDDTYKNKIDYMQKNYPVIYHGSQPQEKVHELIAESHCLIHPSYHEGMANAVLEAAAAGRPCLVSNIPGCRETIDDEKTGLLFDAKSAESLTCSIVNFLNFSQDKRKQMGIAGRKKMELEFDRKIVVNEYINKIRSVFKNRNDRKVSMNVVSEGV